MAAAKTALVYGPNFSVGVNLFLEIVAKAAVIVAKHPEYEAWGWEIHHSAKKDAPSGTLKKLAEEIRAAGYGGGLSLNSNRAGAIPARTKLALIRGEIPSRCAIRREAGKDSLVERFKLRSGLSAKKGFTSFREIFGQLNGKR